MMATTTDVTDTPGIAGDTAFLASMYENHMALEFSRGIMEGAFRSNSDSGLAACPKAMVEAYEEVFGEKI